MTATNPIGLRGICFTAFCGPDPSAIERLFLDFGFSKLRDHHGLDLVSFHQNDIHLLLSSEPEGHAARFAEAHGPSIYAMGWYVDDPVQALKAAVERGARAVPPTDKDLPYPAIEGIGGSLIYFIRVGGPSIFEEHFSPLRTPIVVPDKGFLAVDHLTNNVPRGQQWKWADFYKGIFGFTEVRTFDIQGEKTGLTSDALRSPDGSFCIPINQPKGDHDQIAEYLREYNGPGVQHLAFSTNDLIASLDRLRGTAIETLDIDPDYYESVFDRVPGVVQDHERIEQHQILVDGDEEGYLLQIFTKNLIGPIFIEMIQRCEHQGFGEGNFGALFRSIEKDQERRGVI